eukprot:CAMPEP_0194030142 /NCGR_PEP_ID=MMETSP0009_2-20130614/3732_1 /TAXON_ID=210454 /ORGANISM="Grammatophora oceanica, Strain CCMP 410" /LENGTH=241 /DNA_ID=CAMNT_0038670033 /DNA_START=59 /DNA_END=784 /DNA_ORIENTATION=-
MTPIKGAVLVSFLLTTVNGFQVSRTTTNRASIRQLKASSLDETSASAVSRRGLFTAALATAGGLLLGASQPAQARLEGVNRPELLPKEKGLNVIQTEKFLTSGEERRVGELLGALERDTGYRLRVLCQQYPKTPGLAIRDYWSVGTEDQKDDKYIVLVVDEFGGRGNVLNFNVGDGVKFALPNIFWTRLQAKYGTTFYVKDHGIDLSIINACEAIVTCLRNEDGYCTNVPDEGPSFRTLGL